MTRPGAIGERLLALFLLGVLMFSPPLLKIFSIDTYFVGVPLLYLYLFIAWAVLVVIAASLARNRSEAPDIDADPSAPASPADANQDGDA